MIRPLPTTETRSRQCSEAIFCLTWPGKEGSSGAVAVASAGVTRSMSACILGTSFVGDWSGTWSKDGVSRLL